MNCTNYIIDKITKFDYFYGVLELLNQLSKCDNISYEEFCSYIDNLNNNHMTYVIYSQNDKKIIAIGTLLIEQKLIHNMGKVGHIEDVVVDQNYRNKGIGKKIITFLTNISKNVGCYKTILDCSLDNITFYKKCNFIHKGALMANYFNI